MAASSFAYTLEFDLDDDGTFETDESGRLLSATIRRGRPDALSRLSPGMMTLVMNNADGRWSPYKGTLSGLDHDISVRLYGTWTTPAVTNIDDNPSAETDDAGWHETGGSHVRVTDESFIGGACIKYTTVDFDNIGCHKRRRSGSRFSVTADQTYTWAPRVKGVSGKNMTIVMVWRSVVGGTISQDEIAFTFGSIWMQPMVTATAPTGAVTVDLLILTDGAQGVFDFWADASWFYQGSTILPYVDGSQPGCSWSGTAHESTSSRSANPTFLMFQGYIHDFKLSEEGHRHTATLVCRDRLETISREKITLPNIIRKKSGLMLHRILDRIEGELIANPSIEWTAAAAGNPGTGWSAVGSSTLGFYQPPITNIDEYFEGDWALWAQNDGADAGEGMRYDATSDVDAVGKYEAAVYARAAAGTVQVVFRFLRDAVEEAATVVTLTTAWQRIPLSIDFSTLGTNRYFEIVTNVTSSVDFRADALHCVALADAIPRDLDDGQATLELVNAYYERAGARIDDVVRSEPGLLYVRAKSLSEGDILVFRDRSARSASVIARAVLGDGDGLPAFAARQGLALGLDAVDRITSVTVSSRGSISIGGGEVPSFSFDRERNLSAGDFLFAEYQQPLFLVTALEKGGVAIDNTLNCGVGHDIDVTTGSAAALVAFQGYPIDWPLTGSYIRKTTAATRRRRNLSVSMPLQPSRSSDMDTEAQRLLDKYKNRVARPKLRLAQQQGPGGDAEVIQALQLDLEINDLVIVRAKYQDYSPNVDKRCYVEGIAHRLTKGGALQTVLSLEEE